MPSQPNRRERLLRFHPFFMALALLPLFRLLAAAAEPAARVTLDASVARQALSGRLFVFCSRAATGEPRFGPDWFHPEPFFGLEVNDFQPGAARTIDDKADGFPGPLSKLPAGEYRVQALFDQATDTCHAAFAGGNLYSDVRQWKLSGASSPGLDLLLNHVVPDRRFQETAWLKEVSLKSELLSAFHQRPVLHRAAVVLPQSYQREPQRRYPVLYIVPGFGGTHYDAARMYPQGSPPAEQTEVEFIRVVLSGDCRWGHHVFADSATNGPRGQALVKELVPRIDAAYRTVAAATARFITGHSSGGWSSLWVQVNYPDTFGGVWSTAPDPVDFHDWQQVDLYASPPLSLYQDERGRRRPIARQGGKPVLWYDSFAKMDDALARGGQLRSFEAVFSPLDEDGQPRRMWNRDSGRIDPDVARLWSKYDISRLLNDHWRQLEGKLRGKLHVYTGELDTFYLDGAVRRLSDTLKQLGSDAEIVVVAGKNHGDLLDAGLRQKIMRQMSQSFLKFHRRPARPAAAPGRRPARVRAK